MSIHQIPKWVFDKNMVHLAHFRNKAARITDEKCYFMNDKETLLGVILEGKNHEFYTYAFLVKDGDGKFDVSETEAMFKTLDKAKSALIAKMESWE